MKPSFPSLVEHRCVGVGGRGRGYVAWLRVKGACFEVPKRIKGQEADSMVSEAHAVSDTQRHCGLCEVPVSLGILRGSIRRLTSPPRISWGLQAKKH